MAKSPFDYLSKASSSPTSKASNFLSEYIEGCVAQDAFNDKVRDGAPLTKSDFDAMDRTWKKREKFHEWCGQGGFTHEFGEE